MMALSTHVNLVVGSLPSHKPSPVCTRRGKLSGKKLPPDRYGTRKPSRRQLRVIQLVAQGFKNHEIAGKLGIGEHVVRNYLSKIYDKIGVSNRVELALWYEARVHEGKSLLSRDSLGIVEMVDPLASGTLA
jgi:DNA-binding NarL/FixJ family response regulator